MLTEYLPETVFFSAKIQDDYKSEWQTLRNILNSHNIKTGLLEGTLDIWCRDYMPVQVSDKEFVQFEYNSSYLQCTENDSVRTNPENIPEREQFNPGKSSIILDGGNVVRHKGKVLISERAKTDNPNLSEIALQDELERLLKADVIWIPDHGYDKDMTGHADGLVRFLDDHTLLVNDLTKDYSDWVKRFKNLFEGRGFRFENVPFFDSPDPNNDESAIGIYLNYLQIAKVIIVPVFYSDKFSPYFRKKIAKLDEDVLKRFTGWFPGYSIEPVQINNIAAKGGLVNCITWNTKSPVPLYRDIPLIPVYGSGKDILLIRSIDFLEGVMIDDGYAVMLSLRTLEYTPANRGQNFLRFNPMEAITIENRKSWIEEIEKVVPTWLIKQIAMVLEEAYEKNRIERRQ